MLNFYRIETQFFINGELCGKWQNEALMSEEKAVNEEHSGNGFDELFALCQSNRLHGIVSRRDIKKWGKPNDSVIQLSFGLGETKSFYRSKMKDKEWHIKIKYVKNIPLCRDLKYYPVDDVIRYIKERLFDKETE